MKKIAFVVSSPSTADSFLKGHIAALSEYYEIDLIANFPSEYQSSLDVSKNISVPIQRQIHIIKDLISLFSLIKVLSSNKYDAVHSVTPKAGLLTMTAGWITRVPKRHHTFTGQVWATKDGFSRSFLRFLDKVTHTLSTQTLADSHSQHEFLLNEKVISSKKSLVLADGSISGVNLQRFTPSFAKRKQIRELYEIKESELLLLFLGRINREKGVPELISAFKKTREKHPHIKLMIVGRDEAGMFNDGSIEQFFKGALIRVDFTTEPEAYFNAADIFCLPSHREGFGSVLIEAAACKVPSIASNIYGISDAVINGVTGLLHQVGSEKDIELCFEQFITNPSLRNSLAEKAFERAHTKFSSNILESALINFYQQAFDS